MHVYLAYAYEEFMVFIGVSDDRVVAKQMADDWYAASKHQSFQVWTAEEMRNVQWRDRDKLSHRGPLIVEELPFKSSVDGAT